MKIIWLLLLAISLWAADAPTVLKVEPPDWPKPAHSTTLRILVTGHQLNAAHVSASESSFQISNASASANGSYLFFDLRIDPKVRPGDHHFEIRGKDGSAPVAFAITPALAPADHFQGFSSDDVIYLAMPDRFANGDPFNDDPAVSPGLHDRSKPRYYHGGDFAGIRQKLPYLKSLGITALWLTPVYDNANRLNEKERYDNQPITDYHGYGAVNFYGVEEHFGILDDYIGLIDAAHKLGIKVIQDEVANHTGPYHPWVADPPTPTWFNGTNASHLVNTWQTWTLMDPHASAQLRRSTLEGWFVNILPDLNQNDPEVSRYLIQNTLWWIGRTGLDGIREDTVPYVPRTFWRDWTAAIHREFPKVRIVGEIFEGDPALPSFFQGGRVGFDGVDTGLDSVFDFPMFYAIRHVFGQHKSPVELAQSLAHDRLYPNPGQLVLLLGLHDADRFSNVEGSSMEDLARAYTFLFSVRGAPVIYYGDEIGMRGAGDPDSRRDFPGGWPDDPRNAFTAEGRSASENTLFEHIQSLTKLRASHEALRRGLLQDLLSTESAYVFARSSGSDRVLVVINEGKESGPLHIPLSSAGFADGSTLSDALNGLPPVKIAAGSVDLTLPAHAAAIYIVQ